MKYKLYQCLRRGGMTVPGTTVYIGAYATPKKCVEMANLWIENHNEAITRETPSQRQIACGTVFEYDEPMWVNPTYIRSEWCVLCDVAYKYSYKRAGISTSIRRCENVNVVNYGDEWGTQVVLFWAAVV